MRLCSQVCTDDWCAGVQQAVQQCGCASKCALMIDLQVCSQVCTGDWCAAMCALMIDVQVCSKVYSNAAVHPGVH